MTGPMNKIIAAMPLIDEADSLCADGAVLMLLLVFEWSFWSVELVSYVAFSTQALENPAMP